MPDRGRPLRLSKRARVREALTDLLCFVAGGFLYGASLTCFTAANDIAPGGFSGLAVVAARFLPLPLGTLIFLMNLPLFLLGLRKIGFRFLGKTAAATVIMTLAVDAAEFLPKYRGDKMLAALFGGVLSGMGLALIFLRGATTGGTDILAKLLRRRLPFVPMGRMIMILDAAVIALSAWVFRNLETALFAAVALYSSGRVIDSVLYGSDRGKLIFVLSQENGEIARCIMEELERGVTFLDCEGAYTGRKGRMLMCAVRRNQAAKVHEIVRRIDPRAFVVAVEAGEILGFGFRPFSDEAL